MNSYQLLTDPGHIQAVKSLKRVDEKGYLYQMDCGYDYYQLPKEMLSYFDAGCSSFVAKNLKGEYVFYRNYDYGHRYLGKKSNPITGCNIVVKCRNPNAKYKSVGVADGYWLDWQNGTMVEGVLDDGKTDVSLAVLLPYLCMDGINEAGLTLSILALSLETDWEETDYDTCLQKKAKEDDTVYELTEAGQSPAYNYPFAFGGMIARNQTDHKAWIGKQTMFKTTKENQPTVLHPILMRYMLDNCASVDEAVALADQFNVSTIIPGCTYHILIADKTGKTALLEWQGNEVIAIDINHATNYFVSRKDKLGAGYERDDCMAAGLKRYAKGMDEKYGKYLLAFIAQSPTSGADRSQTQYSCLYNMTQKSLEVFSFGDFEKSYNFTID